MLQSIGMDRAKREDQKARPSFCRQMLKAKCAKNPAGWMATLRSP
jgi:hypothetical protein